MKRVLVVLIILSAWVSQAQTKQLENEESVSGIEVKDYNITVTVDTEKELESLNVDDIASVLKEIESNAPMSFKIVCNGEPMENGKNSYFSIKVQRADNDMEAFLNQMRKIKSIAINYYYQSKND